MIFGGIYNLMDIFDLISALGGLALFLYGMHMLSASLEKVSGNKLSKILEKLTGKTWKSVLLGIALTALVQSSSATTVITVGLVNSGILKLSQAIGIIMGSNVGTTVTAHILRLMDIESTNIFAAMFKPSTFAPIFALIGAALIMFSKKSKSRTIGEVFMAFGVLFIGMLSMEDSLSGLKDSPVLAGIFAALGDNAILGIIAGAAVTALIQSSSASVGILQALASTGAISWAAAVPIILGQNIGTTVTSMLSCVGASKNAKRTALSHLYFNVIGTVVFTAAVFALKSLGIFDFWDNPIDRSGIANFHTIFNVTMTVLFLPFVGLLEKLCMLSIPSDGTEIDSDTSALDVRFLNNPSLAIEQSETVLRKITALTRSCALGALERINGNKLFTAERINEEYTAVMRMDDSLNEYLRKVAEQDLSEDEAKALTGMISRCDDCRHIIEHAIRLSETAEDISAKNMGLTIGGKRELELLSVALKELINISIEGSDERNKRACSEIEPLCGVVSEMTELIRSRHMTRLKAGECSYEAGSLFIGALIDIERMAKHCSNIGVSLAVQFKTSALDDAEFSRRIRRGDTEHFLEHYINYKNEYFSPLTSE